MAMSLVWLQFLTGEQLFATVCVLAESVLGPLWKHHFERPHVFGQCHMMIQYYLVGGLEHFLFSPIVGMMIQPD
jgi:hypothetical protein